MRPGWTAVRRQAGAVGSEVLAGAVASLLPIVNCFTYAALIFNGRWLPLLDQGVTVLLLSGAVIGLVSAATSRFRVAVAGPIALTSALLATVLTALAPGVAGLAPAQAAATALVTLALATLTTGVVLFALGALRLSKLVRLTPYPVIAGFLGATGWLMMTASVRLSTGVPFDWGAVSQARMPPGGGTLLALIGFTTVLILLRRRFPHPLTIPLALSGATLAINLGLRGAGLSVQAVRDAGVLFAASGSQGASFPLLTGGLGLVDWRAVLSVTPYFVPVVVLGVVQTLLTAASLEVALNRDVDLDREMRWQGVANVASALAGGITGFISTSYTTANIAAHGRRRLSAAVAGLCVAAMLLGGEAIISSVPRIVLGGVLLMFGGSLLWEWGVASRRRLARHEWLLSLAIIVLSATVGFLPALLLGLVGSCVSLAMSLSRVGIVRHCYSLGEAASVRQRSEAELQALRLRGGEAQVIELGNFMFFGSVYPLYTQVKSLFAAQTVRTLVFDFRAVTGIDASGLAALQRIVAVAARAGVQLVLSGAAAPIIAGAVRYCGSLDEAIELAEDALLETSGAAPMASLQEWLAVALRDAALAEELRRRLEMARYEAGDVLCREGEASETMFFVGSGRVAVMAAEPGPTAVRLRVFGAHTVLGELGFLADRPRSATLVVEASSMIGQLGRAEWQEVSAAHPAIAAAMLTYLAREGAERLSFATRQIVAMRR